MIGTQDSTAFSCGAIVHPSNDRFTARVGKWQLCKDTLCFECNDAPQAVAVHRACLMLFIRAFKASNRVDALDNVWVSVNWRTPWWSQDQPAFPLRLQCMESMDTLSASYAAELCHMPSLRGLPLEVWATIRDFSSSHVLWHYTKVLSYAQQLISVEPSSVMTSHMLCHVK